MEGWIHCTVWRPKACLVAPSQVSTTIVYKFSAALCLLTVLSTAESIPGYETTYEVIKAGHGHKVVSGNIVTVHATGTVAETKKKFWSTKDPGQKPFTYTAGAGSVITGWDKGCLGMAMGEIRRIDIPAEEGYGARGFPAWGIPDNAGLIFEIEILEVAGVGAAGAREL